MNLIDVVIAIKSRSLAQKPILIAIEGFGGSGKSTLANKLAELLGDAFVVSIDDFIIKENLTENDWDKQVFDRDRLEQEVLFPVSKGKAASYRKSLWEASTLSEPIRIPNVDYIIVEGISSYHPSVAHYYDYKIWVDTPIEVAKSRGKQRDAGNENEQYWDMWAQNDLAYHEKYHPEAIADFVISGLNELDPYTFDQTANGWIPLDKEGKYLEAAKVIESYLDVNVEKIASQTKVSIQTIYFHAGQEYAMAGPAFYKKAIDRMKKSYKTNAGWNLYVDGSIAFLMGDIYKLNEAAQALHILSLEDERLQANANLLRLFSAGSVKESTYNVLYGA